MATRSRIDPWSALQTEARALLRRPDRPALERLIPLIRDVNPTGRALTRAETEARYTLKSSLQSALVRHFHAELTVVPDPSAPGVVMLRHALLDLDACHATVATLDEDARTLVEHALRERSSAPPPSAPRRRPAKEPSPARTDHPGDTVESLIARGLAAKDEYDYAAAQELLTAAFVQNRGALPAARALLELLVDALAADAEALALVEAIAPATMQSPGVTDLLAISAARLGQVERPLRWIAPPTSQRAAEVLEIIVRVSLQTGALDEASGHLRRLRERAPLHPAIPSIELDIAGARALACKPHESAAIDALERGDHDDAERIARVALGLWPESEVARQTLRQCHQWRREQEIDALRSQVTAALARENIDRAAAALASLRPLTPDVDDLVETLQTLRETLSARTDERLFTAMMAHLAEGELRPVLAGWSGLPAGVRQRIQRASGDPAFTWIDRIEPPRHGDAAAVADAVLALREAVTAEPRRTPDEVVASLGPHEPMLRGVGVARTLLAGARAAQHEARCHANAGHLAAARRAVAEGSVEEARRDLGRTRPDLLDTDGRAEFAAIEAAIALHEQITELEQTIERLRAEGDAVRAAARIDDRLTLAPDRDADRWRTLRAALRAEARSAWCVTTLDDRGSPSEMADLSMEIHPSEEQQLGLSADGTDAVFVIAHDRWVFVRVVDPHDGAVLRRITLRAPHPLGTVRAVRDGSRLEVIGEAGRALILDLTNGDILDWIDLTRFVPPGDLVGSLHLHERGRIAWMALETRAIVTERILIVETAGPRVVRELPWGYARTIAGDPEVAGLAMGNARETRFLSARGAGVEWIRLRGREVGVHGAVVHPTRRALVALATLDPDGEPTAALALFDHDTRSSTDVALPGCGAESVGLVASSRLHGALCVDAADLDGDGRKLLWFAAGAGAPRIERTIAYDGAGWMLSDVDQQRLMWASPTRDSVAFCELPAGLDAVPTRGVRWRRIHGISSFWSCERPYERWVAPTTPDAAVARATPEELPTVIERLRGAAAHDPKQLLALVAYLTEAGHRAEATLTLQRGMIAYPMHWAFADNLAEELADAGQWDGVIALLEAIAARAEAPAHLLHLLGVAMLWCGRHDDACAVLERAAEIEDCGCELDDALLLVGVTGDSTAADEVSVAALIVEGCREADEALAAGDPERVIARLHRAPVLGGREVQGCARLAVAHLGVATRVPIARMQKALALSAFVAHQGAHRLLHVELPLATRWSPARVEEIARAAGRWLDEVYAASADDRVIAIEGTTSAG